MTKPRFALGDRVTTPRGEATVLAIAERHDEHDPMQDRRVFTHRAVATAPGVAIYERGYFCHDGGTVPVGYIYYVEFASYSRGWIDEERADAIATQLALGLFTGGGE